VNKQIGLKKMAEVNEKGQKILLCISIGEKVAKFFTR